MAETQQCAEMRVSDGQSWPSYHPCRLTATRTEGGKSWCHVHAPSAKDARRAAHTARWRIGWAVEDAKAEIIKAAKAWGDGTGPLDAVRTAVLKLQAAEAADSQPAPTVQAAGSEGT